MVPFLRAMPAAMADKSVKTYLISYQVHIDLPIKPFEWHDFICQAKAFFKSNFMPFLLFLSGGIAAFHYEKIIASIGRNLTCNQSS